MKSAMEWLRSLSVGGPSVGEVVAIQKDAMADLWKLNLTMQSDREFPFYFPDGRRGKLVIPKHLVRTDIELLQSQLTSALKVIEATTPWVVIETPVDAPGSAGG